MSLVSVLIPVTLVLVGFGVWAFFWAVRSGQFEELDVAAWEVLVDEHKDEHRKDDSGASPTQHGASPAQDPP